MNIGEVISLAIAAVGTFTATVLALMQMLDKRFNKLDDKVDEQRKENAEQHAHVEKALGELTDRVHEVDNTVARWFIEHIEKFHSKL